MKACKQKGFLAIVNHLNKLTSKKNSVKIEMYIKPIKILGVRSDRNASGTISFRINRENADR
ncbi:hypothetical protein EMIT040CA3_100042 [Bacillus pseudomycoides]